LEVIGNCKVGNNNKNCEKSEKSCNTVLRSWVVCLHCLGNAVSQSHPPRRNVSLHQWVYFI